MTLEEQLHQALASNAYRRIVIHADGRTRFEELTPVLRAAREHLVPVVFAGRNEALLEVF